MATQKKLTLKDKASQLLQKAYAKAEAFLFQKPRSANTIL